MLALNQSKLTVSWHNNIHNKQPRHHCLSVHWVSHTAAATVASSPAVSPLRVHRAASHCHRSACSVPRHIPVTSARPPPWQVGDNRHWSASWSLSRLQLGPAAAGSTIIHRSHLAPPLRATSYIRSTWTPSWWPSPILCPAISQYLTVPDLIIYPWPWPKVFLKKVSAYFKQSLTGQMSPGRNNAAVVTDSTQL